MKALTTTAASDSSVQKEYRNGAKAAGLGNLIGQTLHDPKGSL